MPYKKKTKATTLGKNLINSRLDAHHQKQKVMVFTSESSYYVRLLTISPVIQNSKRHTQDLGDGYDYASFSVTEENDLTKFFLTAEMNNKQFQSGMHEVENR